MGQGRDAPGGVRVDPGQEAQAPEETKAVKRQWVNVRGADALCGQMQHLLHRAWDQRPSPGRSSGPHLSGVPSKCTQAVTFTT